MSNHRKRCALDQGLPQEDRPRERLLTYGGQVLSDNELVSILLQSGSRGNSSLEAARELLSALGGLCGLAELSVGMRIRGVGVARCATILAAVELAVRLARTRVPRRDLMDQPAAVASYLRLRFFRTDQECMGALYCDSRQRLIREREIFRGSLSRAVVEPRILIKEALLCDAAGLILFHTHPSCDPAPSTEDLSFTRRVADAGELLGVDLVDHLILGSAGRWVSLGRRGAW